MLTMAAREKRSVSQPSSYREFDKAGKNSSAGKDIQGESEMDFFAPTEDPVLGSEIKNKRRNKSRRAEGEESPERLAHAPSIPEKEAAIAQEITARTNDDIQAKKITEQDGVSHVPLQDIRVESAMCDDSNASTGASLGAQALAIAADKGVADNEKKRTGKTPRKAKNKKNTMSAVEFTKVLASGTTLDMMSDEQVARLNEEQFNQLLDNEYEQQEQRNRELMVRARRHQQMIMREKRLKEQAELDLQEQRLQHEFAEVQRARQQAEMEARRPTPVTRSVLSSFEVESELMNVAEKPSALVEEPTERFQFMPQSGVQTQFAQRTGGRKPSASLGGPDGLRSNQGRHIFSRPSQDAEGVETLEQNQRYLPNAQLAESAKQLADERNLYDCSVTGVKALQQHGLWSEDPPNRTTATAGGMSDERARSRLKNTPPYGLSKGKQMTASASGQPTAPMDIAGEFKEEKIRSGITEKAEASVRRKLTWPQKNLGFKFIQEPLGFNQLTFEHLIVGEITTIRNCHNMTEAKHRMRLLERIGYWKLRGADWSQTRAFYAAIIAGIEAEEFTWDVSFADIESMIIDKPLVAAAVKPDKKVVSKQFKKGEGIWFCKEYNSEAGCELEPGHNITTPRGDIKAAQHICAKCWRLKKVKKEHSEASSECPMRVQ